MNTGELMKAIKEDPKVAERLLYPGKQLHEGDIDDIVTEVIPSGFQGLDKFKILKYGKSELIILGARPSQGKSALGFQIATSIAAHGQVHIFSLEMDHESIKARQVAIEANRPLDYVLSQRFPADEKRRIQAGLERLNCIIDDRPGLNVYQICDAARMHHKRSKTDLIVIDYAQIITFDPGTNRALELASAAKILKELAKELRVPIVLLSQLNRNSEYREDNTPQLSDLKESGGLEESADVVLLIHRPKDTPSSAKIIVAKNRNGPTGEVEMYFAAGQCRFMDSGSTKNILD